MLGVTKPVTLDVTFNGGGTMPMINKYDIGFAATGTLKRSEFGMTNYIPMVGDEVAFQIDLEFHYAEDKTNL
jgi:polyisoprenoid-binding protein YceI